MLPPLTLRCHPVCLECPFGAVCSGTSITARPGACHVTSFPRSCSHHATGYWGWARQAAASNTSVDLSLFAPVSNDATASLVSVFALLPPGFGCSRDSCTAFNSCGGNRSGRLCGSCLDGYSRAMFTPVCVPNELCTGPSMLAFASLAVVLMWVFCAVIIYPRESSSTSGHFQVRASVLGGSVALLPLQNSRIPSTI